MKISIHFGQHYHKRLVFEIEPFDYYRLYQFLTLNKIDH
jgi:hypothetical protein